ncbi:hypothetical protein SAMN05444397_101602 [Flavobacterium aquidurense]|uniref:Uncharacterized protein n=1 Tax=Flavobacterium frigidimaris TaxID=262320 RepID=A0ABX4BKG4_FLAFR|nr:hypothetical protein B0A65_21770 [Flavobacterium frigidimaris]SDY41845.1 hypothetical protein SAMN05444397_101602 [Flavobacterium aquidurense]
MELTVTLLIKFALGLQIILALFFISLDKIKRIQKANFNFTINVFQKNQHYVSFLFTNPSLRFCL